MPEQFGATLFLPEEALRIREVREAMEKDFSELNVGGAVDGVVSVWGLLDWGEMPELEPVLERLGIGFDLCVEAKDEYDGFSVYCRPDPRTGKAVRRELLATAGGEAGRDAGGASRLRARARRNRPRGGA